MTSEELRTRINIEFDNVELTRLELDKLLMDFAMTYHNEQLRLLSVVKPLKEGYKKGFDEWFKNESIETDGKDIYINDVPLRDSDSLIDVYESVEHQL